MFKQEKPRRGGPNGVCCLGNNEPDGKHYIANFQGISIGYRTYEEAEKGFEKIRQLYRESNGY